MYILCENNSRFFLALIAEEMCRDEEERLDMKHFILRVANAVQCHS